MATHTVYLRLEPFSGSRGDEPRGTSSETASFSAADALLFELGGARPVAVPTFVTAPAARNAGSGGLQAFDADDILEIEDPDGFVVWERAGALGEAPGTRSAGGPDVRELPVFGDEAGSRGFFRRIVRKLTAKAGTEVAVRALIEKLETRHLERLPDENAVQAGGELVRVASDGTLSAIAGGADSRSAASGGPICLFIHGTFSSFDGFGALLTPSKGGRTRLAEISEGYQGKLLAFEHATLTKSPLQNARLLVEQLPDGSELHLVSHSRGGMVGQLLALAACGADVPGKHEAFDTEFLALSAELKRREIRVTRFVRVAAPVTGTLLAGKRLDRWAAVVFNLLKHSVTLGAATFGPLTQAVVRELAGSLSDIATSALRARFDQSTLAGLEAMNPASAFVRWLAGVGAQSANTCELYVVSGHFNGRGASLGRKLLSLVSTLFYREPNDGIVHCAAMTPPTGLQLIRRKHIESGHIDHIKYFSNAETADWIQAALAGQVQVDAPGERTQPGRARGTAVMTTLDGPLDGTRVNGRSDWLLCAEAPGKPAVILVPGFPGTALHGPQPGSQKPLWLNAFRLLKHGSETLDIANEFRVGAPLAGSYQELVDGLKRDFEVYAFGYDWRLSIQEAADSLNDLASELREQGKQVHSVSHSTGGLVVRLAHAQARGGSYERHVFLGVPHLGTWDAYELLTGASRSASLMQRLRGSDAKPLMQQLVEYKSLFELLPQRGLFPDGPEHETINKAMVAGFPKALRPQVRTNLADAAAVHETLGSGSITGLCVLGRARNTPDYDIAESGMVPSADGRRGDGTVLHASALLPGCLSARRRTKHGSLGANRKVAELCRLYLMGQYDGMRDEAHAATRGATSTSGSPYVPNADLPWLPTTDAELLTLLTGPRDEAKNEKTADVRVTITHGNLRRARHAVIVGQIEDEPIMGAQRAVDELFDGALTRMRALQPSRYPGKLGTAEFFDAARTVLPGAVVVGIGQIGEVSKKQLTRATEHGLLELARQSHRLPREDKRGATAVLLGSTDLPAAGVESSVSAILAAVAAVNNTLAENGQTELLFEQIEIIELFELRAAQALRAARRYADESAGTRNRFTIEESIHKGRDGRRGDAPTGPSGQRWSLLVVDESEGGAASADERRLNMRYVGRRAGALAITGPMTRRDLEQLGVVSPTHQGRAYLDPTFGTALFNAVIPPPLKPELSAAESVRLQLTAAAAWIPWETMRPDGTRELPWGLSTNLIRTLTVRDSLRMPLPRGEARTALVIGDPRLYEPADGHDDSLKQLPYALHEAERTVEILHAAGWEVTPKLGEDAPANMRALYSEQPQVLHIAGHGLWTNASGDAGIVLGVDDRGTANRVLRPEQISQLPSCPELVFLNCCEIGAIDSDHSAPSTLGNIAERFIGAGARAVVAAAWAVTDDVASGFAATFYERLLSGESLGDAVRAARMREWKRSPSDDTWAAYQVYGDPEFRLFVSSGAHRDFAAQLGVPLVREEAERSFEALRLEADYAYRAGAVQRWSTRTGRLQKATRSYVSNVPVELLSAPRIGQMAAEVFAEVMEWPTAIAIYEALLEPVLTSQKGAAANHAGTASDNATPTHLGVAPIQLARWRAAAEEDSSAITANARIELWNLRVREATRFPHALGSGGGPAERKAAKQAISHVWNATAAARLFKGKPAQTLLPAHESLTAAQHLLAASTLVRVARAQLRSVAPSSAANGKRTNPPGVAVLERAIEHYEQAVTKTASDKARALHPEIGSTSLRWVLALLALGRGTPPKKGWQGRFHTEFTALRRAAEQHFYDVHSVWARQRVGETELLCAWASGDIHETRDALLERHEQLCQLGMSPRAADSMGDRWRFYIDAIDVVAQGASGKSVTPWLGDARRVLVELHEAFAPGWEGGAYANNPVR